MKFILVILYLVTSIAFGQMETDSCQFYIPQTLSPDGIEHKRDQMYEGLEIQCSCELLKFELKIFNRWGNIIFESDSLEEKWYPDDNLPDGTFFYLISAKFLNNKKVEKNGYINYIK